MSAGPWKETPRAGTKESYESGRARSIGKSRDKGRRAPDAQVRAFWEAARGFARLRGRWAREKGARGEGFIARLVNLEPGAAQNLVWVCGECTRAVGLSGPESPAGGEGDSCWLQGWMGGRVRRFPGNDRCGVMQKGHGGFGVIETERAQILGSVASFGSGGR